MSKNLTALSRRKGIDNTLFQKLVVGETEQSKKALAKEFLVGESVVSGTASFYDFIEGENANKDAYVCNGSSCLCAGTQQKVQDELESVFGKDNIGHVTCLGRCYENSAFQLKGENYSGKDIEDLSTIVEQCESNNVINPKHCGYEASSLLENPILTPSPFNLEEFYQQFLKTTGSLSIDEVLAEISESGLRGRGGAGFPTGFKWKSCKDIEADEKYIVCNADEGDAGAFSDRYLLEEQPHLVLFGMAMAGYLVGAQTGVLYIRDEYPNAIRQTEKAISEFDALANSLNLFKQDSWSFKFKIVRGAGAYICGEETALIRSIEGQRPVVSVRPPFPTQYGLFGCPTVLNNVETFASIHWILKYGAEAFNMLGNGKSTGSKLLSLDNCFNNPGILEVSMGTPLKTVIEHAGGFKQPVKALQIGGPLGGVVPVTKINDLTVDFESFSEHGFLLGHAGIIGIPEHFKMIEYMAHLFEFTADESCGKCYPCSLGSVRGQELVEQSINNEQKIDLTLLEDLLETMQLGSLCALGGGVPLPIQNILQYFKEEVSPYIATNTILASDGEINNG